METKLDKKNVKYLNVYKVILTYKNGFGESDKTNQNLKEKYEKKLINTKMLEGENVRRIKV